MTKFRDVLIGETFDWIDERTERRMFRSFFDRCVKVSARKYRSLETSLEFRVGSINAEVFNVRGPELARDPNLEADLPDDVVAANVDFASPND